MINVVVPLAGPDFIGLQGGVKGLQDFQGQPLLKAIIESRPWHNSTTFYIFVFQTKRACSEFYKEHVRLWFPNSTAIYLGDLTQGAALSALAGVSLCGVSHGPLLIDLADIYFELDNDFAFFGPQSFHGINGAFTFESDSPHYSYLLFDEGANFIRAEEKIVISKRASAGAYFFESPQVFVRSVAWFLEYGERYLYQQLLYVCPVLNGVAAIGERVCEVPVRSVIDVKVSR